MDRRLFVYGFSLTGLAACAAGGSGGSLTIPSSSSRSALSITPNFQCPNGCHPTPTPPPNGWNHYLTCNPKETILGYTTALVAKVPASAISTINAAAAALAAGKVNDIVTVHITYTDPKIGPTTTHYDVILAQKAPIPIQDVLGGAVGGASTGAGIGAALGGGVGTYVGGAIGSGAGGVGAIPGALAGAGLGTAIGGFLGVLIGAGCGAIGASYTYYHSP